MHVRMYVCMCVWCDVWMYEWIVDVVWMDGWPEDYCPLGVASEGVMFKKMLFTCVISIE